MIGTKACEDKHNKHNHHKGKKKKRIVIVSSLLCDLL